MTIKNAIKNLERIKAETRDDKVTKRLNDIIENLNDYVKPINRSENDPIPDSIAVLIPNSRIDEGFDFDKKQAGKLQQAVLNMIFGWKTGLPNIFFVLTLVLTLIGIGVPLIWNCVSNDMWYFSIESAKDIIGIIFDGGGAFSACCACATGKKFGGNKSGTFGFVLCVIGCIGAFIAVVPSLVIPSYGFKIYGTIIAGLAMIFVLMGIILSWREPKNLHSNEDSEVKE